MPDDAESGRQLQFFELCPHRGLCSSVVVENGNNAVRDASPRKYLHHRKQRTNAAGRATSCKIEYRKVRSQVRKKHGERFAEKLGVSGTFGKHQGGLGHRI